MSRDQALSSAVKLTEKLTALDQNSDWKDLETIADDAHFLEKQIDARSAQPLPWNFAAASLEAAAADPTPERRKTATDAFKLVLVQERQLVADDKQRKSDSETMSWMADGAAKSTEAHVAAGRDLEDWETDALEGRWLRIVKDATKKKGNISSSAIQEFSDMNSEMLLRKADLPVRELETEEVIAFCELFKKLVGELTPEDRARFEAEITAHAAKERSKKPQ